MINTRQQILDYLDHLQDAAYVQSVLGPAGMPATMDALCQLAQSDAPDEFWGACSFALDVGRRFFMPEEVTDVFRQAISDSGLLRVFHDALHRGNFNIRGNAISTLGRLAFQESVPALEQAFEKYLLRDPLLLPDLLSELFWLMRRRDWQFIDRAVSSDGYLFRWSIVGFLDYDKPDQGHSPHQKKIAQVLMNDANPSVRAEASYIYERMLLSDSWENLTKAEARRRYKELRKKFQPKICFDLLRVRFSTGPTMTDYTVEELDSFHQKLLSAH